MSEWSVDQLMSAPPAIREIGEAIRKCLESSNEQSYPALVEVRFCEGSDFEEYIFEIGIGLTMPVAREIKRDEPDFPADAVERALAATRFSGQIAPQARLMERSVRQLVSSAQADGLPVRVVGVEVAEYGYWNQPSNPLFHVGIMSLGENLTPAPRWLLADGDIELSHAFGNAMNTLRKRHDAMVTLGKAGADGTIDDLALGAVNRQSSPNKVLRSLRNEDRIALEDGTVLMWNNGHVASGDGGNLGDISWLHDVVTLHNIQLPEIRLIRGLGGPVTTLVEHRSLTDKMLIASAENAHDGVTYSVDIKLTLQRHFIDTVAGTYW